MRIRILFSLFLAIQPILDVYGVGLPGVGLGKAIILLISCVCFLRKDLNLNFIRIFREIPRWFKPYAIWFLFVPLLYIFSIGFSISDFLYKTSAVIGFWLTLGVSLKVLDFNKFSKYYQYASVVASCGLILQIVGSFIIGFYFPLVIPQLPLATGDSANSLFLQYLEEDRPASFFLEPSNYSYYTSTGLALALISSSGLVKKLKTISFLTISLVLSRSGSAYLLMSVVYIAYFIFYHNIISLKIKRYLLILLLVTPLSYSALMSIEEFQLVAARTAEFANDDDNQESKSSGYLRMFRGYQIYSKMSTDEQIIGIGHSNIDMFKNSHPNIMVDLDVKEEDGLYFNGISQILIYGGTIGLILYLMVLLPYFKAKITLLFVFVLIAHSMIAMNYNTDIKLLMFVILEFLRRYQNCKKLLFF